MLRFYLDLNPVSSSSTLGFSFLSIRKSEVVFFFFNCFFLFLAHKQEIVVFMPFCSTLRFYTNELFRSWDFHPKRLMILYGSILIETAPKGIAVSVTLDICTTLTKPNFEEAAQKLHTGCSPHLTSQLGFTRGNSTIILCYIIWLLL